MAIDGFTAPGFDGVRTAFEANFSEGREVGAAFCAYHDGRKVVDLWGGIADEATGRPWDERTLGLVYSSTKGATAVCANRLAQEGRLDVEAPVAEYWPEFAAAGKGNIPVRMLLAHEAGMAWVDEKLTLDDILGWTPIVEALERQSPVWEPGTMHGYHAVTYGNLVGEVVRRITGKSLGTYFREAVAEPLGLDFWIGLPEAEEPRVAMLVGNLGGGNRDALDDSTRALLDQFMGPDTKLGKALTVNGAFNRVNGADENDFPGGNVFNTRAVHAAEIPAASGICDARSLARMYAACIGDVDGVRVLNDAQMRDASTQRTKGPDTVILDLDLQFGLGFFVRSSLMAVGGEGSFGHAGAGGSLGWADPDAGLAFGYVMNRMEMGLAGDPRSFTLINACYDAANTMR
jgi:CubicO group peptidase (beta-lactamase class C family)